MMSSSYFSPPASSSSTEIRMTSSPISSGGGGAAAAAIGISAVTGTPPPPPPTLGLNSITDNDNNKNRNNDPLSSSTTTRPLSSNHKQPQQGLPTQEDRNLAAHQANSCLEAIGSEGFQLDGFNLLGVVANPRSGMVLYGQQQPSQAQSQSQQQYHMDSSGGGGRATMTASSPSRNNPPPPPPQQHLAGTAITASAAAAAAAVVVDHNNNQHDDTALLSSYLFSDAAKTLEYTLAQVTEQIESLNLFLEELSRQYLGDDTNGGESLYLEYYYQDVDNETTIQRTPALSSNSTGGGNGGSGTGSTATAAAGGSSSLQLSNLQQLQDLQSYLEECGVLAHSLFALGLETRTTTLYSVKTTTTTTTTSSGSNELTADTKDDIGDGVPSLEEQFKDMPPPFFDTDFDLTDPTTFLELLLLQTQPASVKTKNDDDDEYDDGGGVEVVGGRDDDDDGSTSEKKAEKKKKSSSTSTTNGGSTIINNHKGDYNSCRSTSSLYQPTHELFPIKEPDALAGYLDRVELALQEQVRDKSTAVFHETTRFRQLQANVEDLLQQVDILRTQFQHALLVYKQSKDISNHQKQEYERLIQLLECTMELVRCKASIGGLLSANDHLGAAQQIHYGRRLLQGSSGGEVDVEDDVEKKKKKKVTTTPTNSSSLLPTVDEEVTTSSGVNMEGGNGDGIVRVMSHDTYDNETVVHHSLTLQQLTALSTCGAQFGQYEELVIQNLSEELVDIFFNWGGGGRTTTNTNSTIEKDHVQEMVYALQLCHAWNKTSELYQRRLQQTIRMTVRTTIAEFVESTSSGATGGLSSSLSSGLPSSSGGGGGVTGMSYPAFYSCLQLLIEEIQAILRMANTVDEFCRTESIFVEEGKEQQRWTNEALTQGAELATKSIAELLRLRKESHSVISLGEMRQLWDTCLSFTSVLEGYGDAPIRAVSLRSTLINQAKAFLDRTHESNMSALVAALDSERWSQCEVSAERQISLTRLCNGLATVATPVRNNFQDEGEDDEKMNNEKKPIAMVEGVNYKVVWSCLLLVETIMTNLSAAAHFQSLAPNAVTKVVELLRLFNTRTTNLVLGAGAIHSTAKLKSINAKHLSYVTQCLGMIMALLPHIRAALMAQLPSKQHSLLGDLDKIRKEYQEHNEMVLNKFVSIIGGIVEHGLAPRIANTNFDARAKDIPFGNESDIQCCVFLEGITNSTMKLHQVLSSLLPPDHLQDVFSRIFAYLDQTIPALFVTASTTTTGQSNNPVHGTTASTSTRTIFQFPSTDDGKRRMVLEVTYTTESLNALVGVHPWDFTAMNVLERKMDYRLPRRVDDTTTNANVDSTNGSTIPTFTSGEESPPKDSPTDIPTTTTTTEDERNEKEIINGDEVSAKGNGIVANTDVESSLSEVEGNNGKSTNNNNTENGGGESDDAVEAAAAAADGGESLEKVEDEEEEKGVSPPSAVVADVATPDVVVEDQAREGGTIDPAVNGKGRPSSQIVAKATTTTTNGDAELQHDKDAANNEAN